MKNISLDKLIEKGAIYFNRIEEGFDNYKNDILEGTEEEIFKLLKELRDRNGIENSYVDLYFGVLKEEEKDRIRSLLSDELLNILSLYESFNEVIYIPLSDEVLKLTEALNTTESLFSTYYFCKEPCTIWGNYNLRYPRFTR